jgi:hypothetical protein
MERLIMNNSRIRPHLALIVLMAVLLALASGTRANEPWVPGEFPVLEGEYFGQEPPGDKPEIFAPGIISNGLFNRDLCVSSDGDEIYFGLMHGGLVSIIWSRIQEGRWTEPEILSLFGGGQFASFEPALSADGERLYFLTNRAAAGQQQRPGWGTQNIFFAEREGDGWGKAREVPAPITSPGFEYYPSFTRDGTIYFTRSAPREPATIWRSDLVDGEYTEPEKLGPGVNCGDNRFNAFIAPDESYLILCVAGLPDNIGPIDYYIVFRDQDDLWSDPVNLGPQINAPGVGASSASVSPDGKFLFFSSDRIDREISVPGGKLTRQIMADLHTGPRNGLSDIYWVSAAFLQDLRP